MQDGDASRERSSVRPPRPARREQARASDAARGDDPVMSHALSPWATNAAHVFPSRRCIVPLVATAVLGAAEAQEDPWQQRLAAARRLADEGKPEDAVLAYWAMCDEAVRSRTSPGSGSLAEWMAAAAALDPAREEHGALAKTAAARLTEIARAYRSREMQRSAQDVWRLLASFDPVAAAAPLLESGEQPPSDQGTVEEERSRTEIERLRFRERNGNWFVQDGWLFSPPLRSESNSPLVLTDRAHQDHRIAVTFGFGNRDACAALLFAARGGEAYHIAEVDVFKDSPTARLTMWRWSGGKLQKLRQVERAIDGATHRAEVRLELLVRNDRCEVLLDGASTGVTQCADVLHGRLGFFVTATSLLRTPVEFREFEVTPLPEDAIAAATPPGGDAKLRQRLDEIERALQRFRGKPAEAVAEDLRAALPAALAMPAGKDRTELLARIERIGRKADPIWARRDKTFAEVAAAARALADRYAGHGWVRAADRIAGVACTLDPTQQNAHAGPAAAAAAALAAQSAAAARDPEAMLAALPDAQRHGWQAEDEVLVAPRQDGRSTWLTDPASDQAMGTASVEVALEPHAAGGLVFAHTSDQSVGLAMAQIRGTRLQLTLQRFDGTGLVPLGSGTFQVADAPRLRWVTVDLTLDETSMTLRCLGHELTVPRDPALAQGRFGIVASTETGWPRRVRLRGYRRL